MERSRVATLGLVLIALGCNDQGLVEDDDPPCRSLTVMEIQASIPPTPTADLIEQNGVDPEFDLYYEPNYRAAVRFTSEKLACVWIEPGTTFVGLSGSADTSAPWGVDNAVVLQFLDLGGNHVAFVAGGDGDLEAVRHLPTGEWITRLATASVPGAEVGVPDNPGGLYGFPSRGEGSFDVRPYFTPGVPLVVRVNTLDEGFVGSATDLFLFADRDE